MAALFILILVGYGAAKLRIIDGRFSQQLSVFVINISSPCLIVSSVLGDISPDKDLILPVLAIGCVTYAFFVAVAMLLSRIITRNKDMQGIYGFMLTFGNVGFIGYPIVASIFGKYAIFYASLLNIPFTLLAFSLGKKMIQGGPGGLKLDWKILVSPAMIACYLSTLIVVSDIKGLPNIVTTPITLLGNITVPAALLIIGTSMAQMDLRRIFSGKLVWGISVLRLLILPIVIFYFTRLIASHHADTLILPAAITTPDFVPNLWFHILSVKRIPSRWSVSCWKITAVKPLTVSRTASKVRMST